MLDKLVDRIIEKFAPPKRIGAFTAGGTGEVVVIGDLDLWDPKMTQLTLRADLGEKFITTSVRTDTLKGSAEKPWELQAGSHCIVWGRAHCITNCTSGKDWKSYVESGGLSRELADIFLSMRNN